MLIETFLLLVLMAIAAGFVGAMLGLGGGIILVPGLTLLFHYDVKIAVAASLVSVIATSSAAATVYVSERFTNIRLGMLLEVATTSGALIGGLVAVHVPSKYLYFTFAAILIYAGTMMLRGRRESSGQPMTSAPTNGLGETYYDPYREKTVSYEVTKVPTGLAGSLGAGLISGLLGVGGGIIKVPLMNLAMRVPMKAAIATSNFMIGVTAATGAIVFWLNGKVDPAVAAPTVIGVLIGARLGTRVAGRAKSRYLVLAFVLFIALTAVQMVLKGIGTK
jgi:uncharacterized protein